MKQHDIIPYARGDKPVDLLLTRAKIINVFSGEITVGSIAIAGGWIVGIGDYQAAEVRDLSGRFVAPGFIDPHVHIESSMACVSQFARAVVPHGTTTVVADPHEIANVLGVLGIEYMLKSGQNQPMNVYYTLSSCVPATRMETSGARLEAVDLIPLMSHDRIVALAEMMNYPGVIHGDPDVLSKIRLARQYHKPVDGHSPGLSGKELNAYIASGISSDHECTTAHEAREKLMAGMHIFIRQGTGARNLQDLLPLVSPRTFHRMMWCTDDRHPHDLLIEGHIDSLVRESIASGVDPIRAIQMATLNPAEYFGLDHLGAIAPGRQADLVVFSDLNAPVIEQVYCKGVSVAENGTMSPDIPVPETLALPRSMRVTLKTLDFSIPLAGDRIRVIEIIPNQLITRSLITMPTVFENAAVSDTDRDILKIAAVERHTGSGNIGKGFVKGFGLKKGAIASSVAHDSHNIIVVGTTDEDMKAAVKAVVMMGGGLAVVSDGMPIAKLSLPIAGLMSPEPVHVVRDKLDHLLTSAREIGSTLQNPFMTLSFLSLPVIPELKITDKGLVDVTRFEIVPLFE
ncbi:MAG: adenine deaminase [Desulfatirhabdiaceae bacterium]|nr:adenine deaminase [Desulfatirhabdiaceae bacterium]